MISYSGWLGLMDARSFPSIWFWIAVLVFWGLAGRAVLGVPMDVIASARRASSSASDEPGRQITEPELRLLDWLSLTLPGWMISPGERQWVAGLSAFALACLITLGFGYGLQFAQALCFIAVPYAILTGLRLYLAARLAPALSAAQRSAMTETQAVAQMLAMIKTHRLIFTVLSIVSVFLTMRHGIIWMLLHPYGM